LQVRAYEADRRPWVLLPDPEQERPIVGPLDFRLGSISSVLQPMHAAQPHQRQRATLCTSSRRVHVRRGPRLLPRTERGPGDRQQEVAYRAAGADARFAGEIALTLLPDGASDLFDRPTARRASAPLRNLCAVPTSFANGLYPGHNLVRSGRSEHPMP